MQGWYEVTASQEHVQTESLTSLMQELNLKLPQISQENKDILDKEITPDEVETAINEAHEISAPGPSGQTIKLYTLLFQQLPNIFTAAINQLVFNMELSTHPIFQREKWWLIGSDTRL
jgi:hypothetical protein